MLKLFWYGILLCISPMVFSACPSVVIFPPSEVDYGASNSWGQYDPTPYRFNERYANDIPALRYRVQEYERFQYSEAISSTLVSIELSSAEPGQVDTNELMYLHPDAEKRRSLPEIITYPFAARSDPSFEALTIEPFLDNVKCWLKEAKANIDSKASIKKSGKGQAPK